MVSFTGSRPFHVNELNGMWYVEAVLAQTADGSLADPIVVRDGFRGRLIPMFQASGQACPMGAVGSEVIAWLMQKTLGATKVGLAAAKSSILTGLPLQVTVSLANDGGVAYPATSPVTVTLAKSSATGAFDIAANGAFDGSVTTVTIPAGLASATAYFKDTVGASVTLSASAPGLAAGELVVEVLQDAKVAQGEVAIYTGNVNWLDAGYAATQAQVYVDNLTADGITFTRYQSIDDDAALAEWVSDRTGDGKLDVVVIFGLLPPTLYAAGNAQPDGSAAELFIESTDGDAIINHADYMFYVTNPCCNGDVALRNIMDLPGANMWPDSWDPLPNPVLDVTVTDQGNDIAPSLGSWMTVYDAQRPCRINEVGGNWWVEASLAQNAAGTRSDPTVLRDGNLGRLIPTLQAPARADPKGAVGAEIIQWLKSKTGVTPPPQIFVKMGAVNAGPGVDIADAIALLGYLFAQKAAPLCAKAADANDDDALNIADAITILGYLFSGKPMFAPDHAEIKAANNTCKGYAANGNDGKPFFPAKIGALDPCATPCTP